MKVKESEKAGLHLNIQKMKIMACGPITSWQIDGGKMETVTDFIFLGSKITADSDCNLEIKRHLLLGKKVITNLHSVLKKWRHLFADKGLYNQNCFSSSHVWMWELDHKDGWAPKNWYFWTVVLEKTVESPLDCKKSILKEINPKSSLEGLMLKLKLQYFGHLMQSATHWKRPWCSEGDESESDVTQSCPTLCDPKDCSLSCSSVHGIF